jgi:hypothetical protein
MNAMATTRPTGLPQSHSIGGATGLLCKDYRGRMQSRLSGSSTRPLDAKIFEFPKQAAIEATLENLSAQIRPRGRRQFTFEELRKEAKASRIQFRGRDV